MNLVRSSLRRLSLITTLCLVSVPQVQAEDDASAHKSAAADAGGAKPATPGAKVASGDKLQPFLGRFKSVATEPEKKARQAMVDQAVGEFFFATRSLARKRIEAKTRIPAWLELKQSGQQVTVHFEGRYAETCPVGGTGTGKDPEDNPTQLTLRWDGANLVQTVTTEEGKRTNVFMPQPNGSMKVKVELRSSKFKTVIQYTLSYARS